MGRSGRKRRGRQGEEGQDVQIVSALRQDVERSVGPCSASVSLLLGESEKKKGKWQ